MKQCENKRPEKYVAVQEMKSVSRENPAAADRRDPVSFYDRKSAAESFEVARETRRLARNQPDSSN